MSPSSYMSRWGRALRVFYIGGTGTESASVAVAESINVALSRLGKRGDAVAPWYQVAPVAIEHGLIPRRLGWRLLADGGVGPEVSAGSIEPAGCGGRAMRNAMISARVCGSDTLTNILTPGTSVRGSVSQ